MKLFENGVGRPSNEIKRKRKIFIVSAIALCITLISVLAFALTKVNTNDLIGDAYTNLPSQTKKTNTTKAPAYTKSNTGISGIAITSIWCNPRAKKCNDRSMNLYIKSKGTYAKYYTYVVCTGLNDCTSSNAWDIADRDNRIGRRSLSTGNRTMYMKEDNRTIEGRTFYVRLTTYVSDNASKWANVYVYEIKPTSYTKNGTNRWLTSSKQVYTTYNSKVITTTKAPATKAPATKAPATKAPNNTAKSLTLKCPTSGKTYERLLCSVDQAGVKITVGGAKALSTTASFTTTSSDMTKSINYTNTLFNGTWDIKKDSNGKEYVNAKVTASKSGYTTVTKYIKIYKGTAPSSGSNNGGSNNNSGSESKTNTTKPTSAKTKTFTLKCPESGKTNQKLSCTVSESGVSITLGGANSLASGYSSKFSSTSSKKTINIMYADKLFTNYKSIIKKDSKGKEYINAKVTAKKSGYKTVTKYIKIYKNTTASKSTIKSYNINYSIYKVTKTGNNGEKKLDFKISNVGSDVKYFNHAICFERDACISGDETRYKAMTSLKEAKVGATSSLDITTSNAALLNQDFYVRVMTYDKNKKFIYYKTHHFYTNPKTSSTSANKNISDESKVQIGDFTGTTHDFLFSLKTLKVKSKYQANYAIPSVKKLSELDIDSGVKKSVNIAMHDFGDDVKYVSFVVCTKESYCKKANAVEYVSQNSERGSILQYQVPEYGKEFPVVLTVEDEKMLNKKIYVRIYSYDANKKLMFSKIHEFTTGSNSKLGYKKESEIKVGDRVISEVTRAIGYKIYK